MTAPRRRPSYSLDWEPSCDLQDALHWSWFYQLPLWRHPPCYHHNDFGQLATSDHQLVWIPITHAHKTLGLMTLTNPTPWSRTHTCGPRDHPITTESGNHLVGTNKPPGVLTDGSWTVESPFLFGPLCLHIHFPMDP